MNILKSLKKTQNPPSSKGAGVRIQNPYINGREEWLERYGSYISRAAQWRITAFTCLGILALSLGGNIMQASQPKIVPYIIEIDKLGKVTNVSKSDRITVTPRSMIQAVIAESIVNWRTVTADTELQKGMIKKLSYTITGSANGVLRQWFMDNSPYEIAKSGKLIHIEIKGVPLPVSDTSYRVEWIETTRNHAGALLHQQTYEATVGIQLSPPDNEQAMLSNPGGVNITSLSASKVFTEERKN